MVIGNSRHEIEWVVRDTRWLVSDIDPARLRTLGATALLNESAEVLDEYVTPCLAVARALLRGASPAEAVEVLRREMDEHGYSLVDRRARKLRRYFAYRHRGIPVRYGD